MGRNIQKNAPESVGVAYIAIPTDIDRDSFVRTCYRRNRVSIITDFGSVINECYILDEALERVQFPKTAGEKGSCVAYVSNKFSNKPIIIGILSENDNSSLLEEQMFRFEKEFNGTTILIQGDPQKNSFVINISSKDPSSIEIAAKGNPESKLDINSSGSVNVKADQLINIKSFKDLNFEIKDVEEEESLYTVNANKDNILLHRKNEVIDLSLLVDNEKIQLDRKTDKITENYTINDTGFHLTTKSGMLIDFTDSQLSIKTDSSTLIMEDGKIEFNGGSEDGLVKINALTDKLNNLVKQVNDLITKYNTHIHPATMGATSPTATQATPVTTFNKTDYENNKIIQG